jgi:hypothetical protein
MVQVLAILPVTIPVLDPTRAIPPLLLVHTPPGVAWVSVSELPMQTVPGPEPIAGAGDTVTIMPSAQPVGMVYDIIVVPVSTPVTTPVVEFAVAMAGALLLHIPPGVVLKIVVVLPELMEVTEAYTAEKLATVMVFTA